MAYSEDTPTGGLCRECGYVNGHDVTRCTLVLSGKVKKMPGLSPDAFEWLRAQADGMGSSQE